MPIWSCSEISVMKLSPEPIRWIDPDRWITRWIFGYPKCITCCSMFLLSYWMPIAFHQASNSIKRMENWFLNHIWSFEMIPQISLCRWFTTQSVSAIQQLTASVTALDRWTWNSTCLLVVMFATAYSSSSAAVFSRVSLLEKMGLGPVASVSTSCDSCHPLCWNRISHSLHVTGVTWWISCSKRFFALCQSASD